MNKLSEKLILGQPFSNLGDCLYLTALLDKVPNSVVYLRKGCKRAEMTAPIFDGICEVKFVEKPEENLYLQSSSQKHVTQRIIEAYGFGGCSSIPKVRLKTEEIQWARQFLSQFNNPIVFCNQNGGCHDPKNILASYIRPSERLISILSFYAQELGHDVLQFGPKEEVFYKNILQPLPGAKIIQGLSVRELAACYHVVGKYIGGCTGDYHLMLAVGGRCLTFIPEHSDQMGYKYWNLLYHDNCWGQEKVRVTYYCHKDWVKNIGDILKETDVFIKSEPALPKIPAPRKRRFEEPVICTSWYPSASLLDVSKSNPHHLTNNPCKYEEFFYLWYLNVRKFWPDHHIYIVNSGSSIPIFPVLNKIGEPYEILDQRQEPYINPKVKIHVKNYLLHLPHVEGASRVTLDCLGMCYFNDLDLFFLDSDVLVGYDVSKDFDGKDFVTQEIQSWNSTIHEGAVCYIKKSIIDQRFFDNSMSPYFKNIQKQDFREGQVYKYFCKGNTSNLSDQNGYVHKCDLKTLKLFLEKYPIDNQYARWFINTAEIGLVLP